MKKVLLFPGAFNPPHNGHAAALQKALQQESFDEVWVVPSGKRYDKDIYISYEDRKVLGNLFVESLRGQISIPIKLVTAELNDERQRPTNEVLNELKSQAGINMVQLIGSDGFERLPEGERAAGRFLVIPRDEKSVSSTKIRRLIEEGNSEYKSLMPTQVVNYLEAHQLYRV